MRRVLGLLLAMACVVAATAVVTIAAPTLPASAGTVTQTNACTWITGEEVPMDITVSGSGSPSNPAYLSTFTLSPVTVSGVMPWWAATVGYELGYLDEGPNTIQVAVRLTVAATNATPATQDVVAYGTVSVTFDPDLPFTEAGQQGQLLEVTNLSLPASTWTRTSQFAPTFRQQALTVRIAPGTPSSAQVLKDCFPATWTTDDEPVATPVTAPAFAVVGSKLPDPTFSDVLYDHPFFVDVEWAAADDITNGYPDGTFRPSATVSRQAFASFLYEEAGSPTVPVLGPAAFPDVPKTHPFFTPIEWARQHGIISGYGDGTFKPTAPVTRQAAAKWVMTATGQFAAVPSQPPFPDVPVSHPFVVAIAWLDEHDVASGYPDGTFRPGATVSRQAAVAWLHRATT